MSALAAAAAALLAAPAWAAPAPYELYRGGDLGAALGAYRAADDDSSAEAAAELALLLDEAGRSEEAAARWARACALEPGDAFLWNQRGWSALAAGRAGEAAGAFASAVRVSSGAPAAAEAQFGLGLAQKAGGKRPEAIAALQTAAARSSALLPAAATELARLAVELGKPDESIPLYSMALSGDPRQLDALRESAQAYARLGRPREAWGAWRAASELDPGDPETRRGLDEAIHRLPASPEAQLAAARRLLRPLLRPSVPPPPSPQLRVALFAGEDGAPRELRRVLLMPSAAASVEGDDGEPATTLAAGAPWRVSFSTAAGGVEIADHAGRIVRRSARALRVLPAPGASVLIGSAELATGEGVDARDRELRGGLEVAPSSAGLRLVNVLSVEEYLPAAVGQAAPSGTPLEALKALAVVLRSRAEIPQRHPLGAGLCDSRHCRVYLGLAQESNAAARAARLTAGQTLSGRPGTPSAHEACGW
ncbi:MAG TPA: SpoIID/LytB domain-containing protein, partial [Elusimicrobiota bacterium]|nr:SpoIID/LytB domain-containing protein [Elusimicrobiota bacterium]